MEKINSTFLEPWGYNLVKCNSRLDCISYGNRSNIPIMNVNCAQLEGIATPEGYVGYCRCVGFSARGGELCLDYSGATIPVTISEGILITLSLIFAGFTAVVARKMWKKKGTRKGILVNAGRVALIACIIGQAFMLFWHICSIAAAIAITPALARSAPVGILFISLPITSFSNFFTLTAIALALHAAVKGKPSKYGPCYLDAKLVIIVVFGLVQIFSAIYIGVVGQYMWYSVLQPIVTSVTCVMFWHSMLQVKHQLSSHVARQEDQSSKLHLKLKRLDHAAVELIRNVGLSIVLMCVSYAVLNVGQPLKEIYSWGHFGSPAFKCSIMCVWAAIILFLWRQLNIDSGDSRQSKSSGMWTGRKGGKGENNRGRIPKSFTSENANHNNTGPNNPRPRNTVSDIPGASDQTDRAQTEPRDIIEEESEFRDDPQSVKDFVATVC